MKTFKLFFYGGGSFLFMVFGMLCAYMGLTWGFPTDLKVVLMVLCVLSFIGFSWYFKKFTEV